MKFKIKMPKVADTTDEVVVVSWLVSAGQVVEQGQALVSVETDKAIVEVPAPISGTLTETLVSSDDEIVTGDAIAWIETGT
jgi:pyruvate/2-oxoglutarate dehydrogenase complex dihydrolipoamide acyltransferase (E2) component